MFEHIYQLDCWAGCSTLQYIRYNLICFVLCLCRPFPTIEEIKGTGSSHLPVVLLLCATLPVADQKQYHDNNQSSTSEDSKKDSKFIAVSSW